jgi:acyl-CoA synthetase (NDP forming)
VCLKEMRGPNLGVVTVTGAGGIMAIDACEEVGLKISRLPEGLADKLTRGMPEWIHVSNPIDIWPIGMIGGDYPGAVKTALLDLLQSDDVDGVLAIIPAMNSPLHADIADLSGVVADVRRKVANDKPIAMWLYADDNLVFPGRYEAIEGVASFQSSEQAVKGLSVCYRHFKMKHRIPVSVTHAPIDHSQAAHVVRKGRASNVLAGQDALNVLAAFGIPVTRGTQVTNRSELAQAASELAYPLVLKLAGPAFLHKSEWGGVTTGITDFGALEEACDIMVAHVRQRDPNIAIESFELQEQVSGREILLGLKRDPQFGHVIVCGMGGIYAEVFKDIARELVPIDRTLAERMLLSLKIYPLLKGVRGEKGVDVDSVIDALERLSALASEISDISELDINPLIVSDKGCRAVDARILW